MKLNQQIKCISLGSQSSCENNAVLESQIGILKTMKARKGGNISGVLKCSLLQWCSWFVRGLLHRWSIKHCPWCWILSCPCAHPWQPLVTIASEAFWIIGVILPFSELCKVWEMYSYLALESAQSQKIEGYLSSLSCCILKALILFHLEVFQWEAYQSASGARLFAWSIKEGHHYYTCLPDLVLRKRWKTESLCVHP